MSTTSTSKGPQSFPYDHLFKLLMIGDAAVGKVSILYNKYCAYHIAILYVLQLKISYYVLLISTTQICSGDKQYILYLYLNYVIYNNKKQSSMLIRFTDDAFDEHIQSTIGVDFKVKHLELNNKRIKLTVWDTAGQERFRTLTSSYYRGAQGVVMVYDVTRRDSFDNLEHWLKEVKLYSPNNGEGVVKLLVGNKIDLPDSDGDGEYTRQVDRHEAEEWARNQGMLFLEASAKTKTGVQESFMEVVHKILEDPDLLMNTVPGKPKTAVNLNKSGGVGGAKGLDDDGEGGYCC